MVSLSATPAEVQEEILKVLDAHGVTLKYSNTLANGVFGGYTSRGTDRLTRNISVLVKKGYVSKTLYTSQIDITAAGRKHLASLTTLTEENEYKWQFTTVKLNSKKSIGEDWEPFTATNDGTIYFRKLVEV